MAGYVRKCQTSRPASSRGALPSLLARDPRRRRRRTPTVAATELYFTDNNPGCRGREYDNITLYKFE